MTFGVQFQTPKNWRWTQAAGALALASGVAAIFWGPFYVFVFSGVGLAAALAAAILAQLKPERYPSSGPALAAGIVHMGLLAVAAVCYSFLLAPASDSSLPSLKESYRDANGAFACLIPIGWDAEPLVSNAESGVRMTPANVQSYTGLTELVLRVRPMSEAPPSTEAYLQALADSMRRPTQRQQGDKLFNFSSDLVTLEDGMRVLVTTLDVKQFWIPLQQSAVFGIKSGTLCSVSIVGLKTHAKTAQDLCKALFKNTRIPATINS